MSVVVIKKEKGRGLYCEIHVKRRDPRNARKVFRRRIWFPTLAAAVRHEKRIEQSILSGEFSAAEEARIQKAAEDATRETVDSFVEPFLRYCLAEKAESTWSAREGHLRNHISPCIGTIPLRQVDTENLEELKHDVQLKGLQNQSVNRVLETCTSMLSYAKYLKKIVIVPWVKKLPEIEQPIEWLRPAQLRALLAADDGRWQRLMLLAVRTGLRRGELRALHWTSVDFVMGQILIQHNAWRDRLKHIPKGKRYRYVPVSADALEVLKAQKAVSYMRSKFVFPNTDGGMLSDTEMSDTLLFLCRKAGLPESGWHVFRHTFGAHATMANVHPRLLQKWMGHSSLKMTERYAHLAPEQDEAINRLDLLQEQYGSNALAGIAK